MARAATKDSVQKDMEGPQYGKAIDLIRGPIRTNQSNSSSLGQDNAQHFKRIDQQYGVHRGAAKDFAKIDGMAKEKRDDYLRSLFGLLKEAKFGDFNDLVDQAQSLTKAEKEEAARAKIDAQKAEDAAAFDGKDTGAEGGEGNIHPFPGKPN